MKNTSKVDEPTQRQRDHSSSVTCKNTIGNLKKAMLKQGLVLVAQKDFGKTNTLMVLVSELNAIPIVVDYATQHAFKLGSKFQVKFLNESYFLKKPNIQINNHIILDMSQTNKKLAGEILRDIIKKEYLRRVKAVIKGFRKGKTRKEILKRFKWQIYGIEESQDLIGRYLKKDDDLATAMNCGRNYKTAFVFLSQRIADLNASLVERCAYLIGRQTGDNNLRKISRILGIPRKKLKFIETLAKGEFVFYNGERLERIQFPLFKGFGRAYEFQRRIVQKKRKNLWQKLKDAFTPKEPKSTERASQDIEESEPQYDTSYGLDTEEQEDNEFTEEMDTMFDEDEFMPI